jgi:hypothetical protein
MAQTPMQIATPDFGVITQIVGVAVPANQPVQVLAPGSNRHILSFHVPTDPGNSGGVVWICQQPMQPVVPSGTTGGGMVAVPAGWWLVINGPGSAGWNAISNADNCLTIFVQ